jgi:hypothetical protein
LGTTSWRQVQPGRRSTRTTISTTRVLHMSDCARCRQPLEGDGRWNVTFGGWSHQACRGRAVWPPLCVVQPFVYNPLIALRKMALKEAFAGDEAQTHIQALMVIVGREFVMPRPRQRQIHDRPNTIVESHEALRRHFRHQRHHSWWLHRRAWLRSSQRRGREDNHPLPLQRAPPPRRLKTHERTSKPPLPKRASTNNLQPANQPPHDQPGRTTNPRRRNFNQNPRENFNYKQQ